MKNLTLKWRRFLQSRGTHLARLSCKLKENAVVLLYCMYFKGETSTKAGGKGKERKIVGKIGKEVFIDNVSISIACLPQATLKLEEGDQLLALT